MKRQVDAIQWGGVVAEFFCGLRKPTRFSAGGGVAEFFRGLRKPARFSGGGVVAQFFCGLRKPARFRGGGSTMNFPLMGPFYIFRLSQRGARPTPLNRPLVGGLCLTIGFPSSGLTILHILDRL